MPNIANVLKHEMVRVARKDARAETQARRKAASSCRKDIALLKRRTEALEKLLREQTRSRSKMPVEAKPDPAVAGPRRFSAKGFASHRRRLGLSVSDLARLVGTSPQTIYNWEQGVSRPLAKYQDAIVRLRTVGKNEVTAYLASLG